MAGARQAADGGATGDATARFLRELRQLRDYAGLEQAELAARAHYPHDYIRAAEVGPAPPDLPLLSAYVRGCGGTVEEWEERWRSLTNTPALPLLATRSGGTSTAATAGARIGSVSPAADVPDPAAIVAALNRVAEKIAASTQPAPRPTRSARPAVTPSPASSGGLASAGLASAGLASAGLASATTGTSDDVASSTGTGTSGSASSSTSIGAGAPAPSPAGQAAGTTAASPALTAPAGGSPARARRAVRGRPFSRASRTTIAALIALAICLIVALLAVFA